MFPVRKSNAIRTCLETNWRIYSTGKRLTRRVLRLMIYEYSGVASVRRIQSHTRSQFVRNEKTIEPNTSVENKPFLPNAKVILNAHKEFHRNGACLTMTSIEIWIRQIFDHVLDAENTCYKSVWTACRDQELSFAQVQLPRMHLESLHLLNPIMVMTMMMMCVLHVVTAPRADCGKHM